jgi:hypothetical protein
MRLLFFSVNDDLVGLVPVMLSWLRTPRLYFSCTGAGDIRRLLKLFAAHRISQAKLRVLIFSIFDLP